MTEETVDDAERIYDAGRLAVLVTKVPGLTFEQIRELAGTLEEDDEVQMECTLDASDSGEVVLRVNHRLVANGFADCNKTIWRPATDDERTRQ
jgi:hypothetical protein